MEKAKQSAVCKRAMAVKARSAITVLAVAGVFVFCGREPAHAGLPGLQLKAQPDIYSNGMTTSYAVSQQQFTAYGFPSEYRDVAGQVHNFSYSYGIPLLKILATVDTQGNASDGTIKIEGSVPTAGITGPQDGPAPVLLTGTLTDFAYDLATRVIEMLFKVTGGAMANAAYFASVGSIVGTLLHVNDSSFTGFANSWTAYSGQADTGLPVGPEVPEPGVAGLVLLALCAWFCRQRFK